LNSKGQFSIIAALLVAVILISTVIVTYSTIRNSPIPDQPQLLSAIDETNFAIKQILGFTVGYYCSVLQVTGNSSYARMLALNYLHSGLINIANMHPEWGASFKLNETETELHAYWFTNTSYSTGTLAITYDLTGLGIYGITYETSCRLTVQVKSIISSNQTQLVVIKDEEEPLINLGKQNFKFYRYRYTNLTWELITPDTEPVAFANGTYIIDVPSKIVDPHSYVIQVEDPRGLIVVASSFSRYTCTLTWNSNWWNTNYTYRKRITITNNIASTLSSGYSVPLNINTTSLVSAGKMMPSGNDLRIAYWNGYSWVEIDRDVIDMNTSSTQVWFKTQADIDASPSTDSNYYIYYRNPSATSPPANKSNVYVWFDDFSTNTLANYDKAKWVDVHGDPTLYVLPTYDAANERVWFDTGDNYASDMYPVGVAEADFLMEVDFWANGSYPSDATIALVGRLENPGTSSAHYYLDFSHGSYDSPGITVDSWVNGERSNTVYSEPSDYYWGFNTVHTFRYAIFGSTHKFWWNKDVSQPADVIATDSLHTAAGRVGLVPAQVRGWWDNLKIRKYIEPEPSTSIGQEEDFPSWGSLSQDATVVVELLQNGTMRWLGQNLQLTTQAKPIPPIPVKAIHINQTINGITREVPFQIEDWASDYRIPLGLTSNASVFNSRTMLVFLVNPNVSKVTIWWNGSDTAIQTPYAYANRYFTVDTVQRTLTNGILDLEIDFSEHAGIDSFKVISTVGNSTNTAEFMRINDEVADYGDSEPTYAITNGTVRAVIHHEVEWDSGAPDCPNFYAHIVLTLPANATYYTYQLRFMFVKSQRDRTITDLCPIKVTASTGQPQTENGTIISNTTGLFYNFSASSSAHHWSQFISGNSGAGIMFTDDDNQMLYFFDAIAGNKTGALKVSDSDGRTIELLPVEMAQVNFTSALDVTWHGAVVTFDRTTPIYEEEDGTGLWIIVEYPPTVTVTTQS